MPIWTDHSLDKLESAFRNCEGEGLEDLFLEKKNSGIISVSM